MTNAIELGASLYVPATRADLDLIALGNKLTDVRSIIFCTEDSILEDQLLLAMRNLRNALCFMNKSQSQLRFVRVRNPSVLKQVLNLPGVEKLDGFVLPKATLDVLPQYLKHLDGHAHCIMPTLETREVFDPSAMQALVNYLDKDQVRERILSIRIGGNDLLSLLGMRRPRGKTLYETPIGTVISALVTTFRPRGFNLSAPVYEYFNDPETLVKEVCEDINHGLIGKTAIHPDQINLIESCYKICPIELEMAKCILSADAPAVFRMNDSMCEPTTHRHWAFQTLRNARTYGIQGTHTFGDKMSPVSHHRIDQIFINQEG
jgi:citrate lyase beta subunit